jgi:exonuclease VII small subunit
MVNNDQNAAVNHLSNGLDLFDKAMEHLSKAEDLVYQQAGEEIDKGNDQLQKSIDAYNGGAKYIAIFNYPQIEPYGLLTENHFEAIKQFDKYIKENSRNETSNVERIAYVLPENYGWGLRNPTDKIWGVWETDEKSEKIWNSLTNMTKEYGTTFDIVYESLWTATFAKQHYDTLIYWNGTTQQLN